MPPLNILPPRPRKVTQGGWSSFTSYSSGLNACGTSLPTVSGPGSFLLQSGPGRLDTVFINTMATIGTSQTQFASGRPIFFLDAAAGTSGGPFMTSGDKFIGITPNTALLGTFSGMPTATAPNPITFGTPFFNGLVVVLCSGQPGFTCTWSPEPAPLNF
jgi:hypothetical protein